MKRNTKMADFMDEEADVSSGSESGSDSESDDRRKSEGRSKRAIIDSSEEGLYCKLYNFMIL